MNTIILTDLFDKHLAHDGASWSLDYHENLYSP